MTRRRGILSALVAVVGARRSRRARACPTSGPVNPGCEPDADAGAAGLLVPARPAAARRDARGDRRRASSARAPGPGSPANWERRARVPRARDPRARGSPTRERDDRPVRRSRLLVDRRGLGVAVARRGRDRRRERRVRADRCGPDRAAVPSSRSRTTASGGSPRPPTASCSIATSSRPSSTATRSCTSTRRGSSSCPTCAGSPRRTPRRASPTRSSTSRRAPGSPNPCVTAFPESVVAGSPVGAGRVAASPRSTSSEIGARRASPTTLDRMQTQLEASLAHRRRDRASQMSVADDARSTPSRCRCARRA